MSASRRLAELDIVLPPVVPPTAVYVPAKKVGNLVFTSGQMPYEEGVLRTTGKVGDEVDVARAQGLARACAINALAVIDKEVGIDSVVEVVKVLGFVASSAGFTGQPAVINGASELLEEVFGAAGKHARSAIGVAELPMGAPVELEVIVAVA
ncbi:LysR family transcriptional regulator [Lentzea sp. NBRC 105346]|uniref:RidA family protein n=1 Tax=Lentzea sp. NBRC 105346 TaxID=3032205 RepID=UPI0024A31EC3|nr:RidA family protein [Lentzea sp. NBRC 105346]GLZ34998.1 LysR family transcriptional regulator [Lentzea sp. NBRC 105346]